MLLVIIATLPFALLIYRSAAERRNRQHDQLAERAQQLARYVAARHAEVLEESRKALIAAARGLALQPGGSAWR